MKRLLFILILLSFNFLLKGQSTFPVPSTGGGLPIKQFLGADSTLVGNKGIFWSKYGDVYGTFTDTTAANLTRIKQYPFARIATTTDQITWVRNKTANKWLTSSQAGGSSNNTNITVNNADSTLIICYQDGHCDTLHFNVNIVYYTFINDSTVIACDTSVVCQIDTCIMELSCDTIHVPPLPSLALVSGLERENNVGRLGINATIDNPNGSPLSSYLQRPTWIHNFAYPFGQSTWAVWTPVSEWYHQQIWGIDGSIVDFKSAGSGITTASDYQNAVKLHINYTGNKYGADTVAVIDSGYFGDRIGYLLTTNLTNRASYGLGVDQSTSKYSGIFFHTLDSGNDALTLFGGAAPGDGMINDPLETPNTPLSSKKIATFKTNKQVQYYGYGQRNFAATPSTISGWDANGNFVEIDTADIGGSVTFIDSTKIIICSFGDFLCDTIFTTTGDGGYFTPNQTNITGTTTHNANFNNFIVNNINISEYTAGTNGNYSVAHQDSALFSFYTLHNATATSSDLWVRPDSIRLLPFQGHLNIDTLQQGFSGDSVMVWNKTTGKVGYINASSIGILGITADNGLTASTATNVQLGSSSPTGAPLLFDTYVYGNTFTIDFLSISANPTLSIQNQNGSGGVGADITSDFGIAATIGTTGGAYAAALSVTPSSTNTYQPSLKLDRHSSGTATNGIATGIDFYNQHNNGQSDISNQIISKWTDVTDATRTSQLDITGVNSVSTGTIASFYGSGVVGIGISSSYTATRLNVVDNSLAGASMVKVTSTSISAASNIQKLIDVSLSGANTNSAQSTYGIYSENTHTGTTSTNYGVSGKASGAVTNYGVYGESSTTYGVYGLAPSTAAIRTTGVYGQCDVNLGTGVTGLMTTTNGVGVLGLSTNGSATPITSQILTSSTSSVESSLHVTKGAIGQPLMGMGASLDFRHTAWTGVTGVEREANGLISYWLDPSSTNYTSLFRITGAYLGGIDTLMYLADRTDLTESSATTFLKETIATGAMKGGEITVTIMASDGTDFQSRTLRFIWAAENKAGTTTVTISTPEEVVSSSSGATLTATITAVDAGSGVINFKANAVSSLTQTTLRCSAQMTKNF